ncbi:M14 family metallopeptidase [Glaciecola sp. 1036]|uniref:M14 family metallopeptidase n=1 Tax=Alteromonadaceae TaxID=72275 RepID=UPI003D00AC4B
MIHRNLQILLSIVLLALSMPGLSKQVTSDKDYLPDVSYDPKIPTPESVLGYPVGTWHVRHDQLVRYMHVLAESSDRVSIEVTGYTHEQRPLLLLTITGTENRKNLEQIRQSHIQQIKTGEAASSTAPLIINMGYSVHGNEPSGANASLLVAYYLAAAQDERVNRLLEETVILLDPSLNPDGLSRFAQWANMHKGYNLVSDPDHREHKEHWPSGRTNHYWFDLNRDWLLLTHPESRARIAQFHKWRPHLLTDFHEMGTNNTYFFQPGVPSRKNPWTPDTNVTLTNELAKFHAKALDTAGQMYYSQEGFDDFYLGKGSTYPDAHGSVGILFEQASSRGHVQDSINGEVAFPQTIQNQFTTSMSSFDGALANKQAMLAYQRQFYRDTKKLIDDEDVFGYVLPQPKDKTRFARMLSILDAHQVKYEYLTEDVKVDNKSYRAGSIFIPVDQAQYRLVKSIFSERKSFVDNTFYDVSNWNLGFAFNIDYSAVESSSRRKLKLGSTYESATAPALSAVDQSTVALAYEWFDYNAPKLTQALLEAGIKLRVSGKAFSAKTLQGDYAFAQGTVIASAAQNDLQQVVDVINQQEFLTSSKYLKQITSGLSLQGVDLGSPSISPLSEPSVLLVGGKGTSQYEVGEIWHYLDTRIGLPVTLVDLDRLDEVELDSYSHIIFASGYYNSVSTMLVDKLSAWVKKGGTLIGQRTAVRWFDKNDWIANEVLSQDSLDSAFDTKGMSFGDKGALRAKKLVAGAAFETEIDLSHPLFFGYEDSRLPMFKTTNLVLLKTDNPFEDIAHYTDASLLGGYAAAETQGLINGTVAVSVSPTGRGKVIAFVDNIHFRGYWDGTNKLMANAIFMSPLMN